MRHDLEAELADMVERTDMLKDALAPIFDLAVPPLGYALFVFPLDAGPGFGRFVTNVEQDRMIEAVKELVVRLEQGEAAIDGEEPDA